MTRAARSLLNDEDAEDFDVKTRRSSRAVPDLRGDGPFLADTSLDCCPSATERSQRSARSLSANGAVSGLNLPCRQTVCRPVGSLRSSRLLLPICHQTHRAFIWHRLAWQVHRAVPRRRRSAEVLREALPAARQGPTVQLHRRSFRPSLALRPTIQPILLLLLLLLFL